MQVKQNIKEHMLKLIEEKYNTDAVFEGLLDCIEPLGTHDRKELEKIITNLKQSGGESWAVGEMLQRIIYFLGNLEGYDKEKPRYSACNADPGRTRESWDVRLYNPEEDSGYTVARFFIEEIPDAEKRANDLCDELNQKEPEIEDPLLLTPSGTINFRYACNPGYCFIGSSMYKCDDKGNPIKKIIPITSI